MKQISRREAMILGATAIVSSALPAAAAIATAAPATPKPMNPRVAWAVGTPGDFDWKHIVARTEAEARRFFAAEVWDGECEEGEADNCECEFCMCLASAEAERKPMWDGIENPTSADWLHADLGTYCSRCDYETSTREGGHAIGDEAVCEGCMTLADWDIVDPERAARIRARMAEQKIAA